MKYIFITFLLLCSEVSEAGRWIEIDVNSDVTFGYNHGFTPFRKTFIRGEAKACSDLDLYLTEDGSNSNYALWQIYYYSYYTALLDNGASYKTYEFGTDLDCNTWKQFWFSWEGGVFTMGYGLEPGTNTYLTSNFGRDVPVNQVHMSTRSTAYTGKWRWLIDEPPLFNSPQPDGNEILTIAEDTAQYTVVYTPSGTDPESDTITFSTVGDHSSLFAVYSGVLYTMDALDYETKNAYFITFQATDGRSTIKNGLYIKVTNVIDITPVVTSYSLSIPEELPVGTDIGKVVSIVDDEEDDSWTIYHGGTNSEYLSLDTTTHVFTVNQVMDVDAGEILFSGVYVVCLDSVYNYDYKYLDVTVYDINDNFPAFSSEYYQATLTEGTTAGAAVKTLAASDGDVTNGGFTTSIISENGATSGFSFSLNNFDLTTAATLDYEALESVNFEYVLVLMVWDKPTIGEPLSSTTVVRVTVEPINDHTPVWVTTPTGVTLAEDTNSLEVITQLQASDSDLGPDGEITYFILSVNPASGTDLFTIDAHTGELSVGGQLDYDSVTGGVSDYTIDVRASDNGASPKYIDGTVTVTLTPTNDNAPFFDETHIYVTLAEDRGVNVDLVRINVNDYDGDTPTLSIESGGDGHFSMLNTMMRYTTAVDYETKRRHIMLVKATDGVHNSYISVEVLIQNARDEAPVITMISTSSMAEEQAIGSAVFGGYIVRDPDVGDTLTYAISGTDAAYVNIDAGTGQLMVAQNLDYESGKTQLDLTLTVTDSAGLQDTQSFSITVEDINDLPPVFNPDVYEVEVTENSVSGVSLATFTVSDGDSGDNAKYEIAISSGDTGGTHFKIDGHDLKTEVTPTDYESLAYSNFMYVLVITATDKPGQGVANTGSAIVRVTVKPENEYSPVWSNSHDASRKFNGATLSEDEPLGTLIETFTATDADLIADGLVKYSIVSVTGASGTSAPNKFSIDQTTGELFTAEALDFDAKTNGESSYTVVIKASDKGSSPRTVDGTIVITLTNANDNPPIFDSESYSADMSENSAVGTVVKNIITDDYDGNTVTLSVFSGGDDLFECAGNDVKIKAALDYETNRYHFLIIRANDGVHNVDVALVVNVLDESDEPPVITLGASGASMSEEQAVGTGVCGGYVVTDPDFGDTLTYTLGGADSSYLTIDSATGELSTAQNVNREEAGDKTQLDLTLTVTDQGGQTATQAFTIAVEDINDQVPLFNPSQYTAELTENSAADLSLADLTCTDGDTGDNALFDVMVASGDGGAGVFKMSGLQLQTDSNPPDYEALGSSGFMYTLIITAVDKPTQGEPNTGTAIVRVTVKPENEFHPVWTAPNSDASRNFDGATVSEGDLPGTLITTFQASDDDLGDDGKITYTLLQATDSSGATGTDKFSVDASTGALRVAGELDVDTGTNGVSSYTVKVRASDNGATPKDVDGTIVVTLTNVNDNPPFFDQTDYSADVAEDQVVGTVVTTLNVDDYDIGDVVTMSVASGRSDLFECDGTDVKIKSALNYETDTFHVLIIRASDGLFETDVSLQINVQDVSDETPVITKVASTTMSEEQAIGTGVTGGYVVTDADAGDVLTYSLSGDDSSFFTIDSSNGELSVAQNIDREATNAKTELSLTLTVVDPVGLQATLDFKITVVDINDLPPVFNPVEYTAEVTENSAADLSLVDLTVSDGDEGNNAVFNLDVTSGDGGSGVFKMSGQQLQTTGTAINYESLESSEFVYTLVIKAVDTPDYGESRTGTAIVKVTVKPENEFTPVWTQPDSSGNFDIAIPEDSVQGYVVTTFQASDDDLGDDGVVSYSIVSVTGDNTGNPYTSMFIMDDETGELMVKGELDYDLDSSGEHSYTVVVRASDKGAAPKQVDGTIVVSLSGVNDNPPKFDQSDYSVNVKEDSTVDTVVHTSPVVDYDGDTPTLSVITGRSDLFVFDGYDLKLKGALDYETETTYVLFVSATDGTFSTIVTLHVNVVDVIDERPIITMVGTPSMAEGQTVGTGVYGGYVVTDPDDGDTLTYSLSGADSAYLEIGGGSGTSGELTVAKHVDREGTTPKTSLSLTLTVTDQAGLQAIQDFTITVEDINDITPTFNPSVHEVEVTENTAPDTSLLDLTCADDDTGNNAVFTISIGGGDDTSTKFKMAGQQLQTDNALDYETLKTYILIITAVDTPDQGAPNTGTTVVKVTVGPDNDFSPGWVYPAIDGSGNLDALDIEESTLPGTSILTLSATDQDHGDDGVVVYSIVSITAASGAAAAGMFAIDPNRGNITVADYLDVDAATNGENSYTIIVRASDKASSANAIEGALIVRLSNVNDNPPFFDQSKYKTSIQEDSSVGLVVINFNTQDYDNDAMTLSILSGATNLFEVVGNHLKVKDVLDYETDKFHVLQIRMTDGLFNVDVPVHIDVTDVIDEAPVITMLTTSSMAEEQTIGTPVYGGYRASDPDVGDVLTYALSGADSGYFSIDASNGQLTVIQNVDREAGLTSMSLTVTVTDQAGLQATKDFTITVEDINDLPPVFDQITYDVTVAENTASDVSLLDLTCTDNDTGNNAVFTISVGSGDDTTGKFKFSGQQLQTDASIDFETAESYTLIITAVDTPDQGDPNTGTTVVKVTVTPVNDHTPVWSTPDSSGTFTASVDETASAGHVVASFSASDDDSGDDGLVTYSIVSVTAASGASATDKFSIGEKCGTLVVAASLDYDADTSGEASYTIVVRASDSGTSPKTVDGTITVSLNNNNDNPPYFKDDKSQVDVSEDEQVGFSVTALDTGDFDGDTVTLSILSGGSDLFEISGNDIKLKGLLDYETSTYHVLIVRASDGKYETEISLQVDVTDIIDETPVITEITSPTPSLSEEQTIGTAVRGPYVVTDADAQDELTHALSGDDSDSLSINPSNGRLTVAKNIDRDAGKMQLDLTLTVTDKAGLTAVKNFAIKIRDINDKTPTFSPYMYEVEVSENTAPDTALVDLICTDDDYGNNAVFSLSVDSGDDTEPKFKISGQQLQTDSNAIDYDTMLDSCYTYTLIILATDTPDQGNPNTGVAIVKVTVKPENEFKPVWSVPDASGQFPVTVDEDAGIGDVLMTVQATDSDKGSDGLVTYSIVSVTGDTTGTSLPDLFSMEASTGKLKVQGELDRDLTTGGEQTYTIVIRASDNGTTPNTVEGTIVVSPRNINDNAPSFIKSEYQTEISEDTVHGTAIITLDSEDNDADVMSYIIISGRDDLFEIVGNDVKVRDRLDFETESAYVLLVNVSDGTFTQTVSVHISLTDVNDEPPTIITYPPGSMTEGQIIGTGVSGGFDVTDPDAGDSFTFSLSGGDSPFFNMDSNSGEVSVADHVDRDGQSGKLELTDLILTITDQTGNQASKPLNLIVADLNDLPPTFNPTVYSVEVPENTAAGTNILTLTCTDGDSGNNAVISTSVVSGDDTDKKFTTTDTELYTDANAINYESLEASGYTYSLVIHAVDNPDQGDRRTGTAVVEVKVLPVNEFDPVWTAPSGDGSASISVDEDSELGMLVTTFAATDEDHGDDGKVTYSIVSVTGDTTSGSALNLFTIDSSGQLTTAWYLDRDLSTGGEESYTVVVRASDSGASPKTVDGTVVITLNGVNDNAPHFLESKYQTSINEDSAVETVVITLGTEDPDADAVTLSIASGGDGLFEIDDHDVKITTELDFETSPHHVLVIKATDGSFDAYVSLEIDVADVIDETPVITMVTTGSVSEGQIIGTAVNGGYSVTDADRLDELVYALSGADHTFLTINSSTGVLTVAKDVDREGSDPKTSLSLTLTVTDQGGLQATKDFTITVDDINDSPPTCNPSVFITEVTENTAADDVLLDLTCSDDDEGDNAKFEVTIGSGDDTDAKFKMSGLQLLTSSTPTDYESLKDSDYMYTLIITAVDKPSHGQAKTGTAIVKVTVKPENEYSPQWTDTVLDSITVGEDSPIGTPITTLTADDQDQSADGVVTYEITSIKLDDGTDAADTFVIGAHTGDLQVKSELDAEGNIAYYDISIRAVDGGSPEKDATASIKVYVLNVNDLPPEFSETKYLITVSEDTNIGTPVHTLTVTDPDPDDTLALAVDGDGSDIFTFVGKDLELLQKLDFETKRYHSIIISASDGKHKVFVSMIVIVENVVDEPPTINVIGHSITEEQLMGTIIGNIFTVTDTDEGDTFEYSLSGDNAHLFFINKTTGVLSMQDRVDNDVGRHILDKVTLTVTDEGGQSTTKDLTFNIQDINDNPPLFSQKIYLSTVTESGSASESVMDFTLTDADTGPNAQYKLKVSAGDDKVNPKFSIVGTTLYADATSIDYETMGNASSYELTVEAVDTPEEGQSLTGITTVFVQIASKNEYAPQWKSHTLDDTDSFPLVNITENTPFGSTIANYTAIDDDAGRDGVLEYRVLSADASDGTNATGMFEMLTEDGHGRLVTSSELDADTSTGGSGQYILIISAIDSGDPARSVTATVTVEVNDVYDPVPQIPPDNTEEKWALRGALIVTSTALAASAIMYGKHILSNLKKPVTPFPNRMERPNSVDEVFDMRNPDLAPQTIEGTG